MWWEDRRAAGRGDGPAASCREAGHRAQAAPLSRQCGGSRASPPLRAAGCRHARQGPHCPSTRLQWGLCLAFGRERFIGLATAPGERAQARGCAGATPPRRRGMPRPAGKAAQASEGALSASSRRRLSGGQPRPAVSHPARLHADTPRRRAGPRRAFCIGRTFHPGGEGGLTTQRMTAGPESPSADTTKVCPTPRGRRPGAGPPARPLTTGCRARRPGYESLIATPGTAEAIAGRRPSPSLRPASSPEDALVRHCGTHLSGNPPQSPALETAARLGVLDL